MYPDVTKAQLIAIVQAVIGVAVAFGANVTPEQSLALIVCASAVAAVLIKSDSNLRSARNFGRQNLAEPVGFEESIPTDEHGEDGEPA
jgi:hypothetical protein